MSKIRHNRPAPTAATTPSAQEPAVTDTADTPQPPVEDTQVTVDAALEANSDVTEDTTDTAGDAQAEVPAEAPAAEATPPAPEVVEQTTVVAQAPAVEEKPFVPEPKPAKTSVHIDEVPPSVIQDEPPPVVIPDTTTQRTAQLDYLDKIATDGTELQKYALKAIQALDEAIRPRRPITPQSGAKAQFLFLKWMRHILGHSIDQAKPAWNVLLVYFDQHHGDNNTPDVYTSLSEYRACDFAAAWGSNQAEFELYSSLMSLLRATRKVSNRKAALKEINLAALTEAGLSAAEIATLQRIYQ